MRLYGFRAAFSYRGLIILKKSNMNSNLSNVKVIYGSALTAYQGVVINNDYTFCIKYGHVAQINIRFTTPSSVSGMNLPCA